jgi:hypothetical protein
MRSVLVVANQTAESEDLLSALKDRAQRGDCEFTILIPATPHGLKWATNMDAAAGKVEAGHHRDALVERLRGAGLQVEKAVVGDPDPLAAIGDACSLGSYDELVVSTLPRKVSRWLHLDLPRKAAHATGLPVTSVEVSKSEVHA